MDVSSFKSPNMSQLVSLPLGTLRRMRGLVVKGAMEGRERG